MRERDMTSIERGREKKGRVADNKCPRRRMDSAATEGSQRIG
jgi:hypothetical protein